MNDRERGYIFALPRLLARVAGREVRRAEFSAAEVYGVGVFVFGMACVFLGRVILSFVRPGWWMILLPLGAWIALLAFYFLNSLVASVPRRLGLYSTTTNNPLQHVVILSVMSALAAGLLFDESVWLRSLGILWCALVVLELLALLTLKIRHEQ